MTITLTMTTVTRTTITKITMTVTTTITIITQTNDNNTSDTIKLIIYNTDIASTTKSNVNNNTHGSMNNTRLFIVCCWL